MSKIMKIREKRRKNYFDIDNDYIKLYARHLGIIATAVYSSLCMHSDYTTQRSWPSMETLAEQHGIERHAVSRALKKLEEWNIIKTDRAIDRKKKKRKNNVYTLLSKESWRKLPIGEEIETLGTMNSIESHGIESSIHMASKIPQDGTESSSNKTHIIKPIEEKTNCGQESTMSISSKQSDSSGENQEDVSVVENLASGAWSYEQGLSELINSDYNDIRIIGNYFDVKKWSFSDRSSFDSAFSRVLKPANLLKGHKTQDVISTMKWCNDAYDLTTGWTLETVLKRINDCISSKFVSQEHNMAQSKLRPEERCKPGKYDNIKQTVI